MIRFSLDTMEDHTLITSLALSGTGASEPAGATGALEPGNTPVMVVPIEEFLLHRADALPGVLEALEEQLIATVPLYPPTPPQLHLTGDACAEDDRRHRFFRALRINPEYRALPFVKLLPEGVGAPGQTDRSIAGARTERTYSSTGGPAPLEHTHSSTGGPARTEHTYSSTGSPARMERTHSSTGAPAPMERDLPLSEIACEPFPYAYARYARLLPGEAVPALQVLATAADEPDYGIDLRLFSDNGTTHGREYGFGRQPFGNPEHRFSSQAPFHMGFYHESPLAYRLAPQLARTWPLLRILQFSHLSRFAFRTNCPYWGYRFAGWALHYIQDLTMPYHATAVPGVSLPGLIARGATRALGLGRPYARMIRRVTARHVRMEEILLHRMHEACRAGRYDDPLLQTLRSSSRATNPTQRALPPRRQRPAPGDPLPGQPAPPQGRLAPGAIDPRRRAQPLPQEQASATLTALPSEPTFTPKAVTTEISRTAAGLAPEADRALAGEASRPEALENVLTEMLRETGRWTRAFIAWCIPPPPDDPDPR